MKYRGCAYYPEYWGVKRVETDAKLMQAAGINLVRIGEFAWTSMEPEEGRFTLDWLHDSVRILGRHGIQVLMCTPTPTPPAWLTTAYPDVLLVRGDGTRTAHGSRRHYCTTSDTYRRHTARIVTQLAVEMSRHKNVIAWQLDNEFGPEAGWCHCENCQSRFQQWLRERYGTVEELNARWRTAFWSVTFTDWRQVRLEDARIEMYSSQKLDSRRFWNEMMLDYARSQAGIIRRLHPGAMVTTNGMGPIFPPIDYYQLFGELDVACDDLYFDIATQDANVAALNIYRSYRPGQPYWITETGSGALDHNKPPHAGQFRAWAWSNLAHGGEAHLVFRWRTCLSGHEQELQGILEHSGRPRHRYQAVKACFTELKRLWPKLGNLPLPVAPVAIVNDYQTIWAYESSRIGRDVDYCGLVYRLHRQLYRRNILADFIPPQRDLAGYRLVILPSLMLVKPDLAARLKAFVAGGGTLLAVGQIGMRDQNDNYLEQPGPERLQDLLGLQLEGGMYLKSQVGPDEALWVPKAFSRQLTIPVAGKFGDAAVTGTAAVWAGDVTLRGGEALLKFAGDDYAGQPAVVARRTGKGSALYAATVQFDDALADRLMDEALARSGVRGEVETPEYVEFVRRGNVLFVVNHTASAVTVDLPATGKALVGTVEGTTAKLAPYGVCVVRAK